MNYLIFTALAACGEFTDELSMLTLTSDLSQVFTAIFTAEMVLRLVAMEPYGYFQVKLLFVTSAVMLTDSCSNGNVCSVAMVTGGLAHL